CGLDYYYLHSDKNDQITALIYQIELALENNLPMIFHVRNADGDPQAFDDFFKIIDKFEHISGVVHSFTAGKSTMEECIKRGLYIGLNGIMTFSKDQSQLEAAKSIPLDRLLLETDSPFLTPAPFRGKVNHSGHIKIVAEFLAKLRGEELSDLAQVTSDNAKEVFSI
ncbi:MAG: TatD family hydrolase, partial [Candidatus Saccharimonadales bacterium]